METETVRDRLIHAFTIVQILVLPLGILIYYSWQYPICGIVIGDVLAVVLATWLTSRTIGAGFLLGTPLILVCLFWLYPAYAIDIAAVTIGVSLTWTLGRVSIWIAKGETKKRREAGCPHYHEEWSFHPSLGKIGLFHGKRLCGLKEQSEQKASEVYRTLLSMGLENSLEPGTFCPIPKLCSGDFSKCPFNK